MLLLSGLVVALVRPPRPVVLVRGMLLLLHRSGCPLAAVLGLDGRPEEPAAEAAAAGVSWRGQTRTTRLDCQGPLPAPAPASPGRSCYSVCVCVCRVMVVGGCDWT